MKTALFALVIATAGLGSASAAPMPSTLAGLSISGATSAPSVEAANRKGSRRVGGSGRSGKGGKYVGGRRR